MVPHPSPDAHAGAPTGAPVRVLYVAGTGRSGSTLISNLLGSTPGAVSVGELRYLWERGIGENGLCGCGKRFADCDFWADVLAVAYPDVPLDARAGLVEKVVRADHDLLRLRQAPALVRRSDRADSDAVRLLTGELSRVYTAISQVSGGAVVVDSSKLISFALIAARTPDVEFTVLHLVRDPRGAAHSWSKKIERSDRGQVTAMGTEPPLKSGLLWSLWNGLGIATQAGARRRYVRVRYEDVMADPHEALTPVMRMVGLDPELLPGVVDGHIHLDTTHTVAGNPGRMRTGAVPLRTDAAWVTDMPARDRRLVTAVTAPLLPRLGYRFGGARPASAPTTAAAPALAGQEQQPREFVEDMHGVRRTLARVQRNVTWIREQGLGRVLEEKEIDPLRTIPSNARKAAFRVGRPRGEAVPVFLLGLQRSGTNMVVRGLGMAPEVEVHNENDSAAFSRFKLKPLPVIEALVARSRHTHVLFKPLCDSHRALELLSVTGGRPARVLWAYRDVDGRVRSSLAKFGDGNLQVLREFAAGVNTTRWHVQGMTEETAAFVRSLDYSTMTPETGSALMWWVRNRLYFDQGLHLRDDVWLARYEGFLAEPAATMKPMCDFLGFGYRDDLVAHVTARPPTHKAPLDLDPRVREQCDALAEQLATALEAQALRGVVPASPQPGSEPGPTG